MRSFRIADAGLEQGHVTGMARDVTPKTWIKSGSSAICRPQEMATKKQENLVLPSTSAASAKGLFPDPPIDPTPRAQSQYLAPSGARMSGIVLIVDADVDFVEAAKDALEANAVTVHVRDDAPLEVIRKLHPTVLMVSVELPRGASSGFSICSRVRRDRDLRSTPILLISSEASPDAVKMHAGSADCADDYARKPISADDIVQRIARLIDAASLNSNTPMDAAETESGPPPIPSGQLVIDVGGPPPLLRKSSTTSSAIADEIWPIVRLEDALRSLLDMSEPQQSSKATHEERLQFLRHMVKYHETRDRAVGEAWKAIHNKGQALAERCSAAELRLEQVLSDRDLTRSRLQAVESEFHTFQEEITRIFQEKDVEEQHVTRRVSELEAARRTISEELDVARQRVHDDELRLGIFQEEMEGLHAELDRAQGQLEKMSQTVEQAHDDAENLRARLAMTESVASERADEVERLREKLDRVAIETNLRHGAKVGELESARDDALGRVEELNIEIADLESRLARQEESSARDVGEMRAAIATLEEDRQELDTRIHDLDVQLRLTEKALKASEIRGIASEERAAEIQNRFRGTHERIARVVGVAMDLLAGEFAEGTGEFGEETAEVGPGPPVAVEAEAEVEAEVSVAPTPVVETPAEGPPLEDTPFAALIRELHVEPGSRDAAAQDVSPSGAFDDWFEGEATNSEGQSLAFDIDELPPLEGVSGVERALGVERDLRDLERDLGIETELGGEDRRITQIIRIDKP